MRQLSDERLGAKLRITENRCVLFNSLNYVYLALLPKHWALYAKVDSDPTFKYIYIYLYIYIYTKTNKRRKSSFNLYFAFALRVSPLLGLFRHSKVCLLTCYVTDLIVIIIITAIVIRSAREQLA